MKLLLQTYSVPCFLCTAKLSFRKIYVSCITRSSSTNVYVCLECFIPLEYDYCYSMCCCHLLSSPIAISLGSYMDKAAGRRACTGKKFTQDVSVLSRSCLGRVSVLSRSCLGLVLVLSRCCFGDVSVMSRSCLGRVSVLSLSFFGDVSVLFWCCFVVFLVVFWGSFSDVLVTSRACFGEVSVMCGDGAVMFMMMSG